MTRLSSPSRRPPSRVLPACVLFGAREPSTVARLVVARGVATVDRMPLARPLSHVFEKGDEVIPPSGADFDPSAAVRGIRGIPGVVAPSDHGGPRLVCDRPRPSMLVGGRSVPGVVGQPRPGLGRMVFPLHGVRRPGVVPGEKPTHPVTATVDRRHLSTTTAARLWCQFSVHASECTALGWTPDERE